MHSNNTTRAFVVALKATGKTSAETSEIIGISRRQIDRIYARAIARGFDPAIRPLQLDDTLVADAPRSGRPTKQTLENREAIAIKLRGYRNLCRNCISNTQTPWVQEDEADEEAWSDEEDDGGETRILSPPPPLDS